MKPQYLVYDHNRFSAKMLIKFHYFSKKLSKTGKRTAWQLHGTLTPLIPMSSRVIRVYHYANVRVMAAAVSTLPLRFADNVSLAPCRGSWRISPQARRTLNVSVCPMLRLALSLSKFRGLSARKDTSCRCAFAEWQEAAGGQPARAFMLPKGKGIFCHATLKVGIFAISLVSSRRRNSSSM